MRRWRWYRAGMAGALWERFFYGGLWLTVRRGLSSGRPALSVCRQPASPDGRHACGLLPRLARPLGAAPAMRAGILRRERDRDGL